MISDLKKIRRDGNVIPESMTIEEIAARGWSPDKVVAVHWIYDGRSVERHAPCGVLAKTLPEGDGVAWLENTDETGLRSTLSLLNADGSLRLVASNTQAINGRPEAGIYCWYEPTRSSSPARVGLVFRLDRDQALFQVDIDTHRGTTEGIYPLR